MSIRYVLEISFEPVVEDLSSLGNGAYTHFYPADAHRLTTDNYFHKRTLILCSIILMDKSTQWDEMAESVSLIPFSVGRLAGGLTRFTGESRRRV